MSTPMRAHGSEMVPAMEPLFNLLYRPRFLRIVVERFHLSEDEIRAAF